METTYQWAGGAAYETYVGRWSRAAAREFVPWLALDPASRVVDVGCGTGALTEAVLEVASPAAIVGVDPSHGYVEHARRTIGDPRASFIVAGADDLPSEDHSFDAAVSGLVLNFVPDPRRALIEIGRVVRRGGVIGAYVWDYAGRMELMRYFWDAAVELNPDAAELDEGRRFELCQPDNLEALFVSGGLGSVETRAIEVPTPFRNFDDYWAPFLSGEAPAPGYAMSIDDERRAELRERIRSRLPIAPDGSVSLIARAWAVRGYVR